MLVASLSGCRRGLPCWMLDVRCSMFGVCHRLTPVVTSCRWLTPKVPAPGETGVILVSVVAAGVSPAVEPGVSPGWWPHSRLRVNAAEAYGSRPPRGGAPLHNLNLNRNHNLVLDPFLNPGPSTAF